MSEWKIYRTRYLVKARQLTQPLMISDHSGALQTGQAGDYLVEGSDGTRRISPRHVFEDVYVEMCLAEPVPRRARPLEIPVQPGNPANKGVN